MILQQQQQLNEFIIIIGSPYKCDNCRNVTEYDHQISFDLRNPTISMQTTSSCSAAPASASIVKFHSGAIIVLPDRTKKRNGNISRINNGQPCLPCKPREMVQCFLTTTDDDCQGLGCSSSTFRLASTRKNQFLHHFKYATTAHNSRSSSSQSFRSSVAPYPFCSDNHTPATHIIHAQYQPPVTPNAGNASLLVFYIITLAGWIEARRVVGLEETATYNRHNSTERCCTETRTTWQGHTSMLAAISCVSACQDI